MLPVVRPNSSMLETEPRAELLPRTGRTTTADRSRAASGQVNSGHQPTAVPMDGVSSAFVALSVAVSLLATAGVHGCPIELSHSRVVVKYGDRVSLTCTTKESKENFEGIGWEAKHGGTGSVHENQVTWTVESLTEWEEYPMCFFTSIGGQQCSKETKIVLYTFPDSIDIISTAGSDGVMALLEKHMLTCKIGNVAPVEHLNVMWFKNGISYYNQTFISTNIRPSNVTSVIEIAPLREDNGAVYRCEAHLDLGLEGQQPHASKEHAIKVHYGPDVSCSESLLMVEEGTALEDVCKVTGNPIKSVQWLKDGKDTNQSIPLTKSDNGNYTLKVDGHQSIVKGLTIHIMYGPKITCRDNQSVMENVPFILSCNVTGFPRPNLTFYKDGEEVELRDKLTRKDGGFYTVIASSRQQRVNSQIKITVIYPPSQISELEESVVKLGSDVSLKCSTKGNPQPEYFWEYYNSSNVAENHEDGVTYLSITNATAKNMGLYTCRAMNPIGNVAKTVKLIVEDVCPIEITPNRMVVQYQSDGQQATCKSITDDQDLELYWLDHHGKMSGTSWLVKTYDSFDLKPYCVAASKHDSSKCVEPLNVIVYKPPDSISIDLLSSSSSVVEDTEFQLQCSITKVAPVANLMVRWYHDNRIYEPHSKGATNVTDCPLQNGSACDIRRVPTPVTVLFTISLTATRALSGALFWCESELDLGPEGPQLPVRFRSQPLNLTVHYKPTINVTKLPRTIPVFNGYPEDLVCEADGNPPPDVVWLRSGDSEPCGLGSTLTVSEAGFYSCNASNTVGLVTHQVQVILKEDYLPLIAGFVAAVVIIISVIFAFIYSIYYKNTKMRRYKLKNVKLNNTHNGNVAHNGWESQFPMARLS